jgi:CubicO group peptidase (beta-lactamase class C family)
LLALVIASPHGAAYDPPSFGDGTRLKKITPVFPVIEQLYREHARINHFPGYAFGVVLDGQLVFSGSGGFADVAHHTPATTRTMFRIASMTKSFTAMAILKLRDEGKLRLDDPVENYIPEMKDLRLAKDAPAITLRNLLTHSAGFPEDNPWGDRQLAKTPEELLAFVKKGISLSNEPGLVFEYSNLGFGLLGQVITKVSGIPYQQYIAKNIWQPLRMDQAEWEYDKVPASQLAHGYRWINDTWREEPLLHDGSYGAMGGMITSIESFARYVSLHLAAWPPRDDPDPGPLQRSSLREMHQPWRISTLTPDFKYPDGRTTALVTGYGYGLGWARDGEGRVTISHSGGLPGFGSNWRILPEYGVGVILFANVTYAPTGAANLEVIDTLIRKAHLEPRRLPASDILRQRQQALVKLLPAWRDAEASGIFAINFFLDYPLDTLRKETAELYRKAGKITRIDDLVPDNQLRGSFIIEGEKSNIRVNFTLTPENPPLIQELHLKDAARP